MGSWDKLEKKANKVMKPLDILKSLRAEFPTMSSEDVVKAYMGLKKEVGNE